MNHRESIRVAVVGAGRMGGHHARVYARLGGCRLVAVVDKDLARAEPLAAECGVRATSNLDEILDGVDAVSVAVPTVHHAAVAMPLIERGLPVLVEKPLAPSAAEARSLVEAARRRGSILQVGHSERFNPVVQAMLKMEVRPRFIETQRVSPFTFRGADVGVVLDMMIHDIDVVLHLVGRGDYQVDAVGVRVLGAGEDVANARVRFGDGTVANLTASRLALKTERRIRVFCPTAYLSMDYHKKSGIAIKLSDNLELIRLARERNFEDLSRMASPDFGSLVRIEPLAVDDASPLEAELAAFLDSIREGKTGAASAEEGCAAVEMAERISRTIREQGGAHEIAPT